MDIFIAVSFAFVFDIAQTELRDASGGGSIDTFFGQLDTAKSLDIIVSQNPAPLGSEVILNCGPGPIDEFKATWLLDSHLLQEDSDLTIMGTHLTINPFQAIRSGRYSCLNGDIISPGVYLDYVLERPNIRVDTAVPVLLGDDYQLTCVTPAVDVSFSWYRDTSDVPLPFTADTLGNEMLPSDAGEYTCKVATSSLVSDQSDTVSIDFKVPQPMVEIIDALSPDPIFPIGMDIHLNCRSGFVSTRAFVPKIFWFKDGVRIDLSHDRYTTSEALLIIDSFERTDAAAYSCVEELEGRQSERSEDQEIRYSVPEIAVHIDGKEYNSTSLGPIVLGTHVSVECVSDINGLRVVQVNWYSDTTRDIRQQISLDFQMSLSTSGMLYCVTFYSGSYGMSYSSPWIDFQYAVPKPRVQLLHDVSTFYQPTQVRMKCLTSFVPDRDDEQMDLEYLWIRNGEEIGVQSKYKPEESNLEITEFDEDTQGYFACKEAINGVYSEQSDSISAFVVVPSVQVLSVDGNDRFSNDLLTKIPLDVAVTLICDHTQNVRMISQWRLDNVYIPATASGASLETIMYPDKDGNYSCRCVDEFNNLTSAFSPPLYLGFEVPMPTISSIGVSEPYFGEELELVCISSYTNAAVIRGFHWFHNGELVESSSRPDLVMNGSRFINHFYQETDTGEYQCAEEIDGVVSEISKDIFMTIKVPAPEIVTIHQTTFMLGSSVPLVCYNPAINQSRIFSSRWFKNSEEIFSGDPRTMFDTFTLTLDPFTQSDAGLYSCINQVGQAVSDLSDEYEVYYKVPQPTIMASNESVSLSATTSLHCKSAFTNPSPNLHIQWFKDNAEINAETSSHYVPGGFNLSIRNVQAEHAGEYQCVELIGNTTSNRSDVFILNTFVPTPEIRPEDSEVSVYLGTYVRLFCGSKVPIKIMEWRRDGHILSWNNLNFTKLMEPSDVGTYSCRVGADIFWSDWSQEKYVNLLVHTPNILPNKTEVSPFLGDTLELICESEHHDTQVEWRRDEDVLDQHQHSFLEFMTLNLTGLYSCRIGVNGTWSEWSPERFVSFQVPKPTISADESEVFLGDAFEMTCVSGYTDDDVTDREYDWIALRRNYRNSTNTVIDGNMLLINPITRNVKNNIRCRETIANVTSNNSKRFILDYLVPRPDLVVANTSVPLNQAAELTCVRGYDHEEQKSAIVWYKYKGTEAVHIGNGTAYEYIDNTLTITTFRYKDQGVYQCLDKVKEDVSERSEGVSLKPTVPTPSIQVSHGEEIMTSSFSIMLGDEYQIRCATTDLSDHSISVIWERNQYIISDEEKKFLPPDVMNVEDAASFRCKVALRSVTLESDWSQVLTIDFKVPIPVVYVNNSMPALGDPSILECLSGYQQNHNSSFLWYHNSIVLDDETSKTLLIPITEPSHEGGYRCQEEIEGHMSDRSNQEFMGYSVPAPVLESEPTTARVGETVVLACLSQVVITEPIPPHFNWLFEDGQIEGQRSSVLELENFQANMTGPYKCQEQTDAATSDWSNELYIRIQADGNHLLLPNVSTRRPVLNSTSQSTVPEKSTIRLTCKYTNDSDTHPFIWYKDDAMLDDINGSSVVIKGFTESSDGDYSCAVMLHDGVILRSNTLPLITVDAHALCSCPCQDTAKTMPMNDTEIDEMVSSIKKNLTMDTTSLSSKVRAKTSAPDSRPTSISVGSVAVTFLILVPVIVVSFDCINLISYMAAKVEFAK